LLMDAVRHVDVPHRCGTYPSVLSCACSPCRRAGFWPVSAFPRGNAETALLVRTSEPVLRVTVPPRGGTGGLEPSLGGLDRPRGLAERSRVLEDP